MMREKITKSLQGRILLISMIGLVACILSLYMVSSITIQSVEQHRLENSLMANMSNEIDHLEFCYFTMVRMMQQMGEDSKNNIYHRSLKQYQNLPLTLNEPQSHNTE